MKKKYLFIIFPLFILVVIHLNFYFPLKEHFKTEQSPSPKATAYFLHGMTIYASWITGLHEIVNIDYGSPVMKPFLLLQNYFFEKGEARIDKSKSVEDIMWWMQYYRKIYGFRSGSGHHNSLAITKLSKMEQREIRERLYQYIIRLEKDKSTEKYLDGYKKEIMSMTKLIGAYMLEISAMYEGKTGQERAINFYMDEKMHQKLKNIYNAFYTFYQKYPPNSQQKDFVDYFRYRNLQFIIFSIKYNQGAFRQVDCDSHYMRDYIDVYHNLSKWVIDKSNVKKGDNKRIAELFKSIALTDNPKAVSTYILQAVQEQCTQQYDIQNLLKLKGELNGNRNN